MVQTAPFGSWRSPLTAASMVADAVRLADVQVDGDDVCWVERRPNDQGRQVIVRWTAATATTADVLPRGFSVRTLVHEYGGMAYAVRDGVFWFVNHADQDVWRIDPGSAPRRLVADPCARFADLDLSPDGSTIVAVRERHLDPGSGQAVVNDVVTFPAGAPAGDPASHGDPGAGVEVVADGHDFFAAPRFGPDGRLAWLSWDHPNMPWDGTDLWRDGEHVGGGRDVSVSQPRWLDDGRLAWVDDRSGWWNLYLDDEPVWPVDADLTGPDWVFGQATYVPPTAAHPSWVAAHWRDGVQHLVRIDPEGGAGEEGNHATSSGRGRWRPAPIDTGMSAFASVRRRPDDTIVCIAGSPRRQPAVVVIDPAARRPQAAVGVLREADANPVDPDLVSVPEAIDFPTSGGRTAHALFYAPHLPGWQGPTGERPPLIVMTHGGPTSATTATLDPNIQYLTTRGLAVVDVNYGGSTGYGRDFRNQLRGAWGAVDVDDAVAAARFLADRGDVDPARMVIRGGSAGGYTTLAALTFRPGVFAAGTSRYGVADLESLARDTHKFESRYLDGLIAPYPEGRPRYIERSPIHHTDRLSCPLLLLQGADDKVVPPNQAEAMAAALDAKGIPHAHVVFEGEQHGFRQAPTIVRATELELWFYGRVLGFDPADAIEPVELVHGEALDR